MKKGLRVSSKTMVMMALLAVLLVSLVYLSLQGVKEGLNSDGSKTKAEEARWAISLAEQDIFQIKKLDTNTGQLKAAKQYLRKIIDKEEEIEEQKKKK